VANNPDARVGIISTMAPPRNASGQAPSQSAGSLLLSGLRSFPQSSQPFDSHAPLLSCLLFVHLLINTESCKRLAREVNFPSSEEEEEEDDERVGLVNVVIGNLMLAQREQGTPSGQSLGDEWSRVMVGYLLVLIVWSWESPRTVKEFLSEGANLQVVGDRFCTSRPLGHDD
jgi:hypothetical protein